MNTIKKAVIAAAGLGTRFLPVTKALPKEMLPIANKPLIQYCVEDALSCGIETIAIITSPGKKAIEDHFSRSLDLERFLENRGEIEMAMQMRQISQLADIKFVYQRVPLGLGDAVLQAKPIIGDDPFILFLPDDVFDYGIFICRRMMKIHEQFGGCVLALYEVPERDVNRYGIVSFERIGEQSVKITGLVEKPDVKQAPSHLAIMGRYILTPDIFPIIADSLPSKNGEIQLTDALCKLSERQAIYGYEIDGERYDAGIPFGWLTTSISLALKDPVKGNDFRHFLQGLLVKENNAATVNSSFPWVVDQKATGSNYFEKLKMGG
jgi:UTP--glucose-1-phosphate uridylyltransferase